MKPSHLISLRLLMICLFSTLVACGGGGSSSSTNDDDTDGDGIIDINDAFPNDATESVDTDGDGVGNNTDTDDDNDGTQDDGDAFPLDETETTDTDGDGVGNNADTDDDGDGTPDESDAFPLDETETTDTDDDGTGDNADIDDDNDGLIEISSLEQLDWMRNNLVGTALNDGTDSSDAGCFVETGCTGYELTTDLDFDTNGNGLIDINDTYYDYDGDSSNNGWLPIGTLASPFIAIFEGNGFEIRNLYIRREASDAETSGEYIGLFGYIGMEGSPTELRNINLTWGLIGSTKSVYGREFVGSLAGYTNFSTVTNSHAMGDVNGYRYTGGLIGRASFSTITHSHTTGNIRGSHWHTAGLVGYSEDSIIVSSYATGAVSGRNLSAGGLVGHLLRSIIASSYATGAVSVSGDGSRAGGLVASTSIESYITSSYSTGEVTGISAVGGLTGRATSSTFVSLHWAVDTSGRILGAGQNGGGNTGLGDITGATLSELQCPTTPNNIDDCLSGETLYAGWDAVDHDNDAGTDPISPWVFGDGSTLPILDWQQEQ